MSLNSLRIIGCDCDWISAHCWWRCTLLVENTNNGERLCQMLIVGEKHQQWRKVVGKAHRWWKTPTMAETYIAGGKAHRWWKTPTMAKFMKNAHCRWKTPTMAKLHRYIKIWFNGFAATVGVLKTATVGVFQRATVWCFPPSVEMNCSFQSHILGWISSSLVKNTNNGGNVHRGW